MPGRTENMVRSRIQILKKAEQRGERHTSEKPIEFTKVPIRNFKTAASATVESIQSALKPHLPSPTVPDFKGENGPFSQSESPMDLLTSQAQSILAKSKIAMTEMQSYVQQTQMNGKKGNVSMSGPSPNPLNMDSFFPKNHPKSKLLHKYVVSGPEYSARDQSILQGLSMYWPALQSPIMNGNGSFFSSQPLVYTNPARDIRAFVVEDGLSYPVMGPVGSGKNNRRFTIVVLPSNRLFIQFLTTGMYPHLQELANLHHAHLLGQSYLHK